MSASAHKILIVGPSWVGDMVMAQSLFRQLQFDRPGCIIDVLAPAWSEAILARMPEVRRAIEMPVGHGSLQWGVRRQLGRELAAEKYQQAIVLPNSLKSALVPAFAGIPVRTGWRGEFRYGLLNDIRLLNKTALPLMVERFVALGRKQGAALPQEIPAPKLVVDSAMARHCAEKFQINPQKKLLCLCPGAEFGPAKQWPASYYAELGQHYLDQGWQVALLGSKNDRATTADIISQLAGDCFDLAGKTVLAEAVDILSLASAVASNDSGLMHIAAALDRPLVAIYGATSPAFTPPLSDHAHIAQLDNIECAPCFQRECPLGHHRCMLELKPQLVIEQFDQEPSTRHSIGGGPSGDGPSGDGAK